MMGDEPECRAYARFGHVHRHPFEDEERSFRRIVPGAGKHSFKRLRIEINWRVVNERRQGPKNLRDGPLLRADRGGQIDLEERDFRIGAVVSVRTAVETRPQDDDLGDSLPRSALKQVVDVTSPGVYIEVARISFGINVHDVAGCVILARQHHGFATFCSKPISVSQLSIGVLRGDRPEFAGRPGGPRNIFRRHRVASLDDRQ